MPAEPDRAEALLREALTADLFQAKAHNNLGVLLLAKGDLYILDKASGEFRTPKEAVAV